jgi:hypothetical protein
MGFFPQKTICWMCPVVKPVRRTGEIRFLSPFEPPVRMNNRRTDRTRAAEAMIRRARARQNHSEGDPPDE